MKRPSLIAAALLAGGAVLALSGTASAHDRVARECGDPGILTRITSKFRYQVRHVPHLPDVEIADFRRIHQHRHLPSSEKWPVARRYCGATALLSDGRKREVWYLIENGLGFAGMGDNVEFCVSGFDRWMVYNGRCRVLR
ncbi:MAG: hypothetical protein J0H34_06395 [Rhizobiales bacterium]|nr:hypothetical protein [Hyphomicrobiales bacterium]